MPRKTFDIEKLVDYANQQLATSVTRPDHRAGICTMIEQVLMESGNYGGFRYLDKNEVPVGYAPGINVGPDGVQLAYPERFANTDPTRIQYFYATRLGG